LGDKESLTVLLHTMLRHDATPSSDDETTRKQFTIAQVNF
jgi:hypothetical protein